MNPRLDHSSETWIIRQVVRVGCSVGLRRFCYLKMDVISLEGIRLALLDHEVKIKFIDEEILFVVFYFNVLNQISLRP